MLNVNTSENNTSTVELVEMKPNKNEGSTVIDLDVGDVTYEHVRTKMAEARPPDLQVLLEFQNLNYSVKVGSKKKVILTDLNGFAKPGELTVVMGPTGSGKTSLLTCLARRAKKYSGDLFVNGARPGKEYKRQVGYVMQDDVLFASLTVYQTLLYTAKLRLGNLSAEEQIQKVEDVIAAVGLSKARDTMIGGEFFRGVSGGERKRVNIANEILTNPSLIFLDEPTSGLDTSTALSIMQMLKGMAQSGLTIVTTIHQPSSQMWNIFDNLLLLVEGQCIYFGPAKKSLTYFDSIGLHCEVHWNPADFIMGIILSEEVAKQKGKSLKEQLVTCWKEAAVSTDFSPIDKPALDELREKCIGTSKGKKSGSYSLNFLEQVWVLTQRAWFLNFGKIFDIFNWLQTLIIALLIGVIWFQTDFTTSAYVQRGSLIFFAYTYIAGFNPAFEALFQFPMDRAVVVRERASGSYRLSAYYVSKFLIEVPWYFPTSLLFMIIFYFMTRLAYDAGAFFASYFIIILCMFVSSSFGLMISAATLPNSRLAMTTLTVSVLIFLATGGFFVQNYPIWINWVQYTSYIKYSYNALIAVQSNFYFIDDNNFTSTPNILVNGTELAKFYFIKGSFPYEPWMNCLILLLFGWSFRIFGFIFLSLSITRNNNLA